MKDFIDFLASLGLQPADAAEIIADDKKRRFHVAGDKRGQSAATYQLAKGEFGYYGWVHSFKEGITHAYTEKASRKFSDEERRQFARNMAAQKKKSEDDQREMYAEAATAAVLNWKIGKPVPPDFEYIVNKKIAAMGCKFHENHVIIPAYKDGKITSLQRIYANGDKRFLSGGDIKGAYAFINKGSDFSEIYVCEGYATGVSLFMAVEKPVIIAFNAGNLQPVCDSIRNKYPYAKIIIAADNDAFTKKPTGELWNVGLEKSSAAAEAVGGVVIMPDLINGRNTDWNDVHRLEGLDALRQYIQGKLRLTSVSNATEAPAPANVAPCINNEWRESLSANPDGKLVKSSLNNLIQFLNYHEDYAGMFRYNEFSQQIMTMRPMPDFRGKFSARRVSDTDIITMTADVERFGLSPSINLMYSAIQKSSDMNRFNPARDYFDGLRWDRQERLKNWLTYFLGAEDDPAEYLAFIGTKWLTAAVKRIYEPGCKFDHILVVEGEQGIGKSTALRELATFGRDEKECYFTDGITITQLSEKDTVQKVQGSIIVEIAELSGFSKKDDDEIKQWITTQEDDVRMPYAKTSQKFKRQFVLAATTNSYDYLKDPSGNRRYWCFRSKSVDIDGLIRQREQLWAEAVHNYKAGMYIGPTPEEIKLAENAQEKRRSIDVLEDRILEKIGHLYSFRLDDLFSELGYAVKDMNQREQRRITNILRSMGYDNPVVTINGKRERQWQKKAGAKLAGENYDIAF